MAKDVSLMRRRKQRGAAAIVEFMLAFIMLTPLALGMITVGLGLSRYLQTSSVNRSAASMFVRGADFNQQGYERILGKIADGLGATNSSYDFLDNGTGVIILSVIMRVGGPQCVAGGFPAPAYAGCTNKGFAVVTRRVVLGNTARRQSAFATPTGGTQTADGSYSANFYLTDTSVRAAGFGMAASDQAVVSGAPVHLAAGELTYLAESYFIAPDINIMPQVMNLSGFYHRNFF